MTKGRYIIINSALALDTLPLRTKVTMGRYLIINSALALDTLPLRTKVTMGRYIRVNKSPSLGLTRKRTVFSVLKGEFMTKVINRRPIGNFFIKRALQIKLIRNIVFSGIISTIVSSSSLFFVYYLRYKTVVVYQLDRITQDLSRENIFDILLPALLISAIVSIMLSFGIGLYSSRKYTVPIYKLEQWISLLLQGKFSATMQFREKDEMSELSGKCHNLGVELQKTFISIRTQVERLKEENASPEAIQNLENILSTFDLEADPIKVTTTFCKIQKDTPTTY